MASLLFFYEQFENKINWEIKTQIVREMLASR